jgi:two-component system OmpR family response regulator
MMVSVNAKPVEARILVVDDEPNILELLSVSLRFQGFEVATASSGSAGLDTARTFRPDAVILDVMMPGMDGFGMLQRLRADGVHAPVLFLTAKDAVEDKISGLTLGADDYVTKPFSLEEVVTRLRVILRRSGKVSVEEQSARIRFADIELDDDTREVWKAGELVSLSPTEFTLLRYFIGPSRFGRSTFCPWCRTPCTLPARWRPNAPSPWKWVPDRGPRKSSVTRRG